MGHASWAMAGPGVSYVPWHVLCPMSGPVLCLWPCPISWCPVLRQMVRMFQQLLECVAAVQDFYNNNVHQL